MTAIEMFDKLGYSSYDKKIIFIKVLKTVTANIGYGDKKKKEFQLS